MRHVIFEPISREKSVRILDGDLLSHLTILKPNILQLQDLANALQPECPEEERYDPSRSARHNSMAILRMVTVLFEYATKLAKDQGRESRLKTIIVTLGREGVALSVMEDEEAMTLEFFDALKIDPLRIKSAVGAGDSFLAGLIYGLIYD